MKTIAFFLEERSAQVMLDEFIKTHFAFRNYQKVDGSRRIAPFLNPEINKSHSFKVLYNSLCKILQGSL
jgi:hypothetical protein